LLSLTWKSKAKTEIGELWQKDKDLVSLKNAFQQAMQVQEGAKRLQEELEQLEIQGESSDGLIKVFLSGNQEPRRVEIAPEALDKGAEVLSQQVSEAMKDAYSKSSEIMRSRMEELTSGIKIPGM
jgi:DNA-binding YbaB/EbfC family protein